MDSDDHDVTRILNAASAGDRQAAEELMPRVYEELRRLATSRLGKECVPTSRQAFIGRPIEEAAEALGIFAATAKRDWIYAKAWLFRELKREGENS